MAKVGIKRGSKAHALNVQRINEAKKYEERLGYHIGMVQALDIMCVSLGRMTKKHPILRCIMSEWFWKDLDLTMEEACKDYGELFTKDAKEDEYNTYGKAVFDREYAEYVPASLFCDWDTRYDTVWHTTGLRVKK